MPVAVPALDTLRNDDELHCALRLRVGHNIEFGTILHGNGRRPYNFETEFGQACRPRSGDTDNTYRNYDCHLRHSGRGTALDSGIMESHGRLHGIFRLGAADRIRVRHDVPGIQHPVHQPRAKFAPCHGQCHISDGLGRGHRLRNVARRHVVRDTLLHVLCRRRRAGRNIARALRQLRHPAFRGQQAEMPHTGVTSVSWS